MKSWFKLLMLLLFIFLAACQNEESLTTAARMDNEQKIVWMHHFNEEGARKWINYGTGLYKQLHPETSFAIQGVDANNYLTMLRTKVLAGEMPDLYMIDSIDDVKDLIQAGYAMDLKDQPFLSQIENKYLSGVKSDDGSIWALPIDMNGAGVIYNKDVFAKAGITNVPVTWKQFLDVCKKLKDSGVIPIAAGYKDNWTIAWDINPDILYSSYSTNPRWMQEIESGEARFADDRIQFSRILERFSERLPYINDNPFETDWNEALKLLASGKAAMIINGTWTIDGVKSINPESNIGLFAFPASDRSEDAKFAVKSTGGIVVNPKSAHKDTALEVLKIFSATEMGRILQENKKVISVIKGLKPDFDSTYIEFNKQYLETAKTFDWSKTDSGFMNPKLGNVYINSLAKFIVDKNHNVEKCMEELDAAFDTIRKPALR